MNFHIFRDDVIAFMDRYIDGPVMLGGHSLGGAVALLINQKRPENIKASIILDPPTLPPSWRFFFRMPRVNSWLMKNFSFSKKARARNSVFPNADHLFDHYSQKRLFKNFKPNVLRDYIEGGTRPHENGIELCCAPAWEARIFLGHDNDIFGAAKMLPKHSRYILAGERLASSPLTRFRIGLILGKKRTVFEKEFRHLFPMEDPDYVARHMNRLLIDAGLVEA